MSTVRVRRTAPALLVLLSGVIATPASAHAATPVCHPAPYTASADATLLRLGLLDLRPLGVGLPPLLDARVGLAHADVDSTRRTTTTAEARYADAALLGLAVPLPGSVARQTAPADNPTPATTVARTLDAGGLVGATVGESTASARWQDRYGCGEVARLSSADTAVTSAEVLPGDAPHLPLVESLLGGTTRATPLVRVASVASARAGTETVRLDGGRVGVAATAAAGIADVALFDQIRVRVLHQPSLTVVSAASRADAAVRYDAPLLEVTLPGGRVQRLDTPKAAVDATVYARALPGRIDSGRAPAALGVRLSIGELSATVTERGAVRAEAATLRLQVSLAGAPVADIGLGLLSATATAPGAQDGQPTPGGPGETGYPHPTGTPTSGRPSTTGPAGSPSPTPVVLTSGGGGLPVTGVRILGYAAGGLALAGGGLLLLWLARRRRGGFTA
ncbi:hypothetical protein Lfu02_45640 [Longispora fulva]|uniref:Uncharacterized protein n=1 Tax=Longispora fulva TaxID=619741 RepID=A0A8J7GSN5_9ACTN|nr:hypothetical protein [Longispora fulva]MBG6137939.1 hypothetical protein [Longispora fulva]GIG60192.1 hypothetical protein Lfu02_45640 [Longispora fulva]